MKLLTDFSKKLLIVGFLVSSSLFLSGCTFSQEDLVEYGNIIREADILYEQREYAQSIKKYAQAADLAPSQSDAFFGIVTILTDKGQLAEAGEIVEKSAGKIDAGDRSRLSALVGNGYLEIGDLVNAEKYYVLATRGVENTSAKVGLAKVYIKSGQLDKAGNHLDISQDDPNFAQVAILKAFLRLENTGAAKSDISELDSTDVPEEIRGMFNSYLNALNNADADKLYTATALSREYINAGYPYLAIKVLEPYKEQMVEYADGLYFLGRAYYDYGQYGSAITVLQEATSFGYYTSEIYSLLAKAYYINDDNTNAFEHFEKAITFSSVQEKPKILKEYIALLFDQQQYTKALTFIAMLDEHEYETNIKYIEVYYAQRNYEKMRFYIDNVKTDALTDEEKKEYMMWAITYEIENGDRESVREMLDQLRALDRFNPQYYLLLGKLEMTLNNQQEGREALERAIDYDLSGESTQQAKRLLARTD